MITKHLLTTATLATLLMWPVSTWAADHEAEEAHIELSRGPVVGSPRVVGLGGAYVSIGEGLAGMSFNPAALGNRNNRMKRWWDWDAAAGISFLPLNDTDYENDGHANSAVESQQAYQLGAMIQGGYVGFGWQWSSRVYKVDSGDDKQSEFSFDEHLLGLGYQIEHLGLAIGISGIIESTRIDLQERGDFTTLGIDETLATAKLGGTSDGGFSGFEAGAIYKPQGEPYRVGAALRMTSEQSPLDELVAGDFESANVDVPSSVRSPTEIRVGASWQFGKPYNPKRRFPSLGEVARGEQPEATPQIEEPAPEPEAEPEPAAEPATALEPPHARPLSRQRLTAEPADEPVAEPVAEPAAEPAAEPEPAPPSEATEEPEEEPEEEEPEEDTSPAPSEPGDAPPSEGAEPAPKLLAPAPWLTARLLTPRHLATPDRPKKPAPTVGEDETADDHDIYALLALDLVLSPSQSLEGVTYKGPEGFAVNREERAGTAWTAAVHAGAEFEPFPRWVKARLGSYYEPSRFEGVDGRVHVTGGFDVHFPHIWAVRKAVDKWNWDPRIVGWVDVPLMAQITVDRADHYLSIGVSIGVWN